MASITEPGANLAELAKRLRIAAEVLRSLPADHPQLPEELEALRKEIGAVAAQLRRKRTDVQASDCTCKAEKPV